MKSRRPRIMLIEDSPTQAERVRILLEREGWEVIYHASAEAALDNVVSVYPDLILVDYYLPGMNGGEFCREMRQNVNTRGIPVLMLTVEGSEDAETRGLESGADSYLAKSVDPDILLARVRALLRKSTGRTSIVDAATFPRRARLLAVAGSRTYLSYLASEMATEHFSVESAASAGEVLERLAREPFDCVLTEYQTPDIDGIELCRRIDQIRRQSTRPMAIVMLAPDENKDLITRALEAGADNIVSTASDISVLKARIRALLRRQASVEENRRILEELNEKELETVRARAEKEAAEMRAMLADRLAESNRELEQANRKLQEALGVTKAITEHAAEALFLVDAEERITYLNPAAEHMFGYPPEELLGASLHEKLHHHKRDGSGFPAEQCALLNSLRQGITLTGHEDLLFRKDGTTVEVACSMAPIMQDGAIGAGVLVVRDVSERKRSEEKLRQMQKLESIGLLAGGIAHDFNNILTSVIGTASLMQDDLPDVDPGNLETIIDSAQKAAGLTRQLLAYAGKGSFVIQALDCSAVIRETASLMRLSVPRNIELRFNLDDTLPPVESDPGQLQQILMNLVINAGEAIGPSSPGVVTVNTGVEDVVSGFSDAAGNDVKPGRYVWVEVTDTGCGMDEQTRNKIFDPFFTTKFTGRGMGLAAVAGIMRTQHGAITISTAPGAGSTFRAMFPAAGRYARSSSGSAISGGRQTVLVVDDEETVRQFLRRALERSGYTVVEARNGKEALTMWESRPERIDLIILDLIMPVMAGEELLREIRLRDPGTVILLTSGYDELESERLCSEFPKLTFIQKPYTLQELLRKVDEVARNAADRANAGK